MIDWILSHAVWNSVLVIALYWAPLLLCAYGYTVRTWQNYRKDIKCREEQTIYIPTDTIGSLIGRSLITILPIGNLLAATFDVAPDVFENLFDWFKRVFSQPLVPERSSAPDKDSRND